jgi:hypothetical protein
MQGSERTWRANPKIMIGNYTMDHIGENCG